MPQDVKCPKCSHAFPVTEARHAFTVACPRCEAAITAEFKKPAAPPEAGQPPYELLVKPGALPGTTTPPPAPRKKKDEDDEPVRKGGSAMIVLVSGGLGLLFVLVGLSLTGWFLFTQVDVETTSNSSSNSNRSGLSGSTSGNRNNPGPKGPSGTTPGTKGNPNFNPGVTPGVPDPFVPPPPPPKPKDTFELRPVNGNVPPISVPANIDAAFTTPVQLPGRAGAVAVGGGGRFIVFHFPQEGRLAVFDANTGGLLGDGVGTENGDVLMTAGANKVVTTVPGTRKMRVYSLPDLQREKEFDSPLFHGPRGIAMGSRTNGPVLAVDPFGEVALMDLTSGKPIEGAGQRLSIPQGQLRAAADGRMFLSGNGYGQNDKFKIVDETSKKWRVQDPDITAAYIGPDGKRLYGKDQIVTTTGAVLAGKPAAVAGNVWYVPAVTATNNYFLRVNEVKIGTPPRTKNGISVAVHRDRSVDTPVLTAWEGLAEAEGLIHGWGAEPLDKHLFLIPEAKLLVILNRDKTRLVVRKLSI